MKIRGFYSRVVCFIEIILRGRLEAPTKDLPDTVILASFPKSGNTWLRFVTANVVAHTCKKADVDFHTIRNYSPEIRYDRDLKQMHCGLGVPNFLKTHFYFTYYVQSKDAVVLFRKPIKALESYYHYLQVEQGKKFKNFDSFLWHPRYGVFAWINFHRSWLNSKLAVFVNYDNFIEDPKAHLLRTYSELGYELTSDCADFAINHSSRERMRYLESERGDPMKKNYQYKFVGDQSAPRVSIDWEKNDRGALVSSLTRRLYEDLLERETKLK